MKASLFRSLAGMRRQPIALILRWLSVSLVSVTFTLKPESHGRPLRNCRNGRSIHARGYGSGIFIRNTRSARLSTCIRVFGHPRVFPWSACQQGH
jgi:hypothetical protein